jgi:hypothetical protein
MGRINWERAQRHVRTVASVKSERVAMDAASQWLAMHRRASAPNEQVKRGWRQIRKRRRDQRRKQLNIAKGAVIGEIDGVRMLMKPGSKPASGTLVSYFGTPCQGCGSPSQVREHKRIGRKQLSKPFYFTRWFFCIAVDCPTRQFYLDEFKVWNSSSPNGRVPSASNEQISI